MTNEFWKDMRKLKEQVFMLTKKHELENVSFNLWEGAGKEEDFIIKIQNGEDLYPND